MSIDFDQEERTALDLAGKVVVVVGAGQSPGPGMGNGRAEVVAVDLNPAAVKETVELNVNMLGCYHCNLFAAQCMERNGEDTNGSIVNVSSSS